MRMFLCLLVLLGLVRSAARGDQTNQFMIGNEPVDGKIVNGKLVGDRVIAISNELYVIHTEITPIERPADGQKASVSEESDSGPCLRLLMSPGSGPTRFGGVKGLHGELYMADNWRTPAIARTNRVDILSSEDNSRIAVMVADNGPIYTSTNSGMTWATIDAPGKYEFRLSGDEPGDSYIAAGTIRHVPQNQPALILSTNWYAIGSAADGSKMILTKNMTEAAPALRIVRSDHGAIVSWPNAYTAFVLQMNDDLLSTNWTDVPATVKMVGAESQVYVPSPTNNAFFRLRSK